MKAAAPRCGRGAARLRGGAALLVLGSRRRAGRTEAVRRRHAAPAVVLLRLADARRGDDRGDGARERRARRPPASRSRSSPPRRRRAARSRVRRSRAQRGRGLRALRQAVRRGDLGRRDLGVRSDPAEGRHPERRSARDGPRSRVRRSSRSARSSSSRRTSPTSGRRVPCPAPAAGPGTGAHAARPRDRARAHRAVRFGSGRRPGRGRRRELRCDGRVLESGRHGVLRLAAAASACARPSRGWAPPSRSPRPQRLARTSSDSSRCSRPSRPGGREPALVPFVIGGRGAQHVRVVGAGNAALPGTHVGRLVALDRGGRRPRDSASCRRRSRSSRRRAVSPPGHRTVVQIAGTEVGRVGAPSLLADGGLFGTLP